MKKVLLIIALVVLVALPLFGLTACGGGQSLTEKDIQTIRGLIARVDNVEAQIANLQGKVANISPGTAQADVEQAKTDIAAIKADLAKLKTDDTTNNTKIAELEARIKVLETKLKVSSSDEEEVAAFETRWYPTVEFETTTKDVSIVDYSWNPVRIKEEDTYRFTIKIACPAGGASRQILVLVLTPSTRDTSIDIGNTGLYSVSPVGIFWDVDYFPTPASRSQVCENCKRIEFISEEFNIPPTKSPSGYTDTDPYKILLDFDLYYAE